MVEAEVMEVMEVTEAMETRMALGQIMTETVTRRDLVMEAIEVLEDEVTLPTTHQVVVEAKEALEDGKIQIHSSMETLGTISLHIIMKNLGLSIVIVTLAGHWK